ncbi:alpha/beta fold hydrolase [Frankia sp. CNm7]|uniref:alpha/beta fold hydrolase n=1 Tax=Frankia nepalensis TaxID=1836974 RepID=UPI001933F4EB|nr:alpha/beta fold hydrolase [Frankia nepalensis]MBL7494772.1 alpha/beta fold hydrolase [Frankia nepalensis]MBL7514057.1 alpha/beta fold hydrolase [Frankia nepalensis]MBL7518500.1 alpha/beta fold hydrolase [Frankia nepalensis]
MTRSSTDLPPFETVVIPLAAGDVEVRVAGPTDGRPLLLLHGALCDASFWDAVAERLAAAGYRCLAPTLPLGAHRHPMRPGTDLSPPGLAALIAQLVERLGAAPVAVVSNDSATALTQLLLAARPELVDRAVLTSGDAFDHFLPPIFRPVKLLCWLPGGMRALAWVLRTPQLHRLPMTFGWLTLRGLTPEQTERWSGPLRADRAVRRDTRAILRGAHRRHTLGAVQALGTVTAPVLLAWSEHDRAFPRRLAERLAETFPNAELATVPDAAAFSPIDNPDRVAALVAGFVPTSEGRHLASRPA